MTDWLLFRPWHASTGPGCRSSGNKTDRVWASWCWSLTVDTGAHKGTEVCSSFVLVFLLGPSLPAPHLMCNQRGANPFIDMCSLHFLIVQQAWNQKLSVQVTEYSVYCDGVVQPILSGCSYRKGVLTALSKPVTSHPEVHTCIPLQVKYRTLNSGPPWLLKILFKLIWQNLRIKATSNSEREKQKGLGLHDLNIYLCFCRKWYLVRVLDTALPPFP